MAIDSRNEVLCLMQKRGESLKKKKKTTHITNNCGRSLHSWYINKCPEGAYKLIIQAHFSYSTVKSWFKDNDFETLVALDLECQFYGCSTPFLPLIPPAFYRVTNVYLHSCPLFHTQAKQDGSHEGWEIQEIWVSHHVCIYRDFIVYQVFTSSQLHSRLINLS